MDRLQRLAKRAVLVEHIGDAARHAGGEVAPGLAEHDDDAAGHVLAAVVAGALDDRDGAGVAHREALAGDAAEIASPAIAPYSTVLPTMIDLSGDDAGVVGRAHDDQRAARQALADIVVGLAVEVERDAGARGRRRSSGRRCRSACTVMRVVGQARHGRSAWRPRPTAWRRPCGRRCGSASRCATGSPRLERRLRLRDQLAVEHLVERVVLRARSGGSRRLGLRRACGRAREKSRPLRLPVVDRRVACRAGRICADHLVEACGSPVAAMHLAHFLGDEEEVVDDVLGLALEALAQHRVLRRDADRAGVEMALAHHDAAGGDQRRGGEAELVGAEQRADRRRRGRSAGRRRPARRCGRAGRSAPASAASRRGRSPRAMPACLIEVSGEAPVPPSIAGDRDVVGVRLGDAGRDRADADLGDELHRDVGAPG